MRLSTTRFVRLDGVGQVRKHIPRQQHALMLWHAKECATAIVHTRSIRLAQGGNQGAEIIPTTTALVTAATTIDTFQRRHGVCA